MPSCGKSNTLGLVLCQSPEQVFADAFLPRVILGVEQAAMQENFHVLLKAVEPTDSEGYARLIRENHVDGIILSGPRQDDSEILRLHDEGVPLMLLGQLPDVPLASNFTAQVLQAVATAPRQPRTAFLIPWWERLSPTTWARRAILASGLLGLIVLSGHSYQWHTRLQLARSVAEVSRAAALPDIEILRDYDAISRLSQVPPVVDEDLLAALQ